jgi:hypothetical protein
MNYFPRRIPAYFKVTEEMIQRAGEALRADYLDSWMRDIDNRYSDNRTCSGEPEPCGNCADCVKLTSDVAAQAPSLADFTREALLVLAGRQSGKSTATAEQARQLFPLGQRVRRLSDAAGLRRGYVAQPPFASDPVDVGVQWDDGERGVAHVNDLKAIKWTANDCPGFEGSVGPFGNQKSEPHVYARDVHSGAGNCVCGVDPGHWLHVQIAPGVDVPDRLRTR